ncbi:hypothetical protein [Flagellimonas meridianipacifica]|uniref:Uncharacterized protein n=1 Tax=Flagellimonas meridianipacifica TaxID=1080225 RepID=A0A2T0M6E0_9FLAO|nr:hypothetical protein [Allomuricauda pacifica]PRX53060.1 hypothetical protein CLV81_3961 [Allomuricauda pacifica]
MKAPFSIFICLSLFLVACKTEPKKSTVAEAEPSQSILEKIASAHGYENWKAVKEFHFTFNVDRDSTHFERSWIWKPKTNQVTAISANDTLTYFRKEMDSVAYKTNGGFINDRYWVLAPFNLVWDQNNFEYEHTESVTAPISNSPMQKLTIVYSNEGGYTPGDAYDFYFGDDFILREWVFRKENQAEPSMTTTWENYIEIGGLQLAQDHKKPEGGFNLNFTNLKVVTE